MISQWTLSSLVWSEFITVFKMVEDTHEPVVVDPDAFSKAHPSHHILQSLALLPLSFCIFTYFFLNFKSSCCDSFFPQCS